MQQNDRTSQVKKTSTKRRIRSSMTSCKPCSVVLEYLPKRKVEDWLLGNNIWSDEEIKDREEKKRRSSRKTLPPSRHEAKVWRQRERKARRRSAKEPEANCLTTEEYKPKNTVVHKQLKRVESQIFIEDSSESDSESRASECEQKLEEFRKFLREEKLCHDNIVDRRYNEVKDSKMSFELSSEKESSVLDHSELKTPTPKRFSLSLKKKNRPSWSDDKISGQVSRREIVSTENTDVQIAHLKQMIKRKIAGSMDAEASASKLKRLNNQRHEDEDRRPEHPDRQVQRNRISEYEPSPEVGSKAKNMKNLRVSLVRLELMGNLAKRTQNDKLKPLDRYIDVSEKDRDRRSETEETKPQNPVEISPSKIRNTKITDYFFKIEKRTIFNDDDKKSPTKPDNDLVLKEKFGISKDPVVALVDLKKAKTPGSECFASERREPDSSIDLNSKCTTAISPPSSSVSHSNILSPSFRQSTTNHTRLPSRLFHPLFDENSPDKKLPAAPKSLTSHKTPQMHKISPSTSTEDEVDSSVKHRTPTVRRDEANSSIRRRIQDQEASKKDSRMETNSSRPITEQQPSPTKTNEAGNNSLEKTTPKLLKIVSSHSVNVTLTPRKRLDLITVDSKTNETRVEEKQEGSRVLGDRNEPREVPTAASEVDQNVDVDADERVTLVRSPIIGGHSVSRAKQTAQKRMPVNSMTFISREIIDDNSAWIDLDIPRDSANATNSQAEDFTLLYCTETLPNDDVKMEKKKTPKKIPDHSSPMLKLVAKNLSAALSSSENIEYRLSRLNSEEIVTIQLTDSAPKTVTSASDVEILGTSPYHDSMDPKSSTVLEYLISRASEKVSPLRLAAETVKPHSNGVDTLLQEKIGDLHGRDSETSVPSTEISAPSETSLVEDVDQDRESSQSQTDLQTDEEEGDLLIDTGESDSDIPSADTSAVSTNSVTIATNVVNEPVDQETLGKKECILCKRKYTRVSCLRKHLKVHVKSVNEGCQICHKPIVDEDMIEHLIAHSLSVGSNGLNDPVCHVCNRVFKKKSGLITHLKSKHNSRKGHGRRPAPNVTEYNKCTVCLLACESEEAFSTHMRSHSERELQDAYQVAKAKQLEQQNPTIHGQNEASDSPDKEKTAENEKEATESTKGNDTSKDCEISVCLCHKEERLEISRGVIIELALACIQCKTFFKTSRCFKDHYSSTPCTLSKDTVITPKLFCNKCFVILNSLGELHSHLAKHDEVDVEMKTSFLCKRCNMFYFGIGELFYAHWFEHLNDPMYVADHRAFPTNMRVNIVEPESTEPESTDEPMQSLFIAEHQCQTCQTPFQTKAEFKKHVTSLSSCSEKMAENPKLSYKLVCSMCNKEYSDKSTFDNHIETHGDIRDFLQGPKGLGSLTDSLLSCSFCKTKYDGVTKYKEHLTRHRIMEEKFYCSCCYLMMDSLEDFEQHFVGHKGSPEKSITCKVVFAKAKFHCEPCILRFDDQSLLDEHLAAHSTPTTSEPESANDSTPDRVSDITKKSPLGSRRKPISNDTAKPNADVSSRSEDTLGKSIVNTVVIDLSDDSDSSDIEIIEEVGNKQSGVVLEENNSNQEEQKTEPVFLRVKNLKELLPFDCKACKAEFDTQLNLSKHVCTPNISPPDVSSAVVTPAQDKDFNYFCTICKKYQAVNDADWNLHILSHFPLKSTTTFNDSCYCVTTQQNGLQDYTCKFCHFKSLTIHVMRDHFANFHPNMYRPRFQCRVCPNFETDLEQNIRRHEFSHFRQPPLNSNNNLPPLQPIENSNSRQLPSTPTTTGSLLLAQLSTVNNTRLPIQLPPISSSGNNSPMYQVMRHFTTPQQSAQVPPVSSGDTASFFQVSRNFTNTQRTLQAPPPSANLSSLQPIQNFTGSEGSLSTFQSVQTFINSQQVHNSPASSTANNSSTLQPAQNFNNTQPSIPPPPVTSSGNDSSSPFQTIQNFTNSQQQVQLPSLTGSGKSSSTFQPVHNSNNTQQGHIATAASSANNSCALQPMQNLNKQHPPVQSTPVTTSSGNNSSLLQSMQNQHPVQQSAQRFNSTQQPQSIPSLMSLSNNVPLSQSVDNLNNFQQSVLISSNQGTADSLSSVQQIQNLNNTQPLNNWNKYQQQSTTVPPVISEANNSSPYPSMDNSQWLTTTAGTVQIQINNTPPYNNMTHTVHTVPLYVANILYCCRICKNFKSSSEQEMKIHESLHDVGQTGESTQKYYQCKACTNASFCTEEQLKAHMEIHHNANEQSNGANIRTQCRDGASNLQCRSCTKVFDSSAQLIKHTVYNTCHKYPGIQPNNQSKTVYPHTCQSCSIVFVNEAFLREHIRQRHPEVKLSRPKTSNGKNLYQCESCGLLLISEETLSYHMKSHSIGNGFH